jgi:pilus assembly protein CpaB
MEASSTSGRIGGKWPGQALSGRRGGIYVAVAAAVLAGVLIFAFVQHYKKNSPTPVVTSNSVVVAVGFIPTGTPAGTIAAGDGFQRLTVKAGAAVAGAITDTSQLTGEVAAKNIYPGQQITAADFATGRITIGQYLTSSERAMSIPVDATHGLQGYLAPGDRVDLLTNTGATNADKTLATNLQVLSLGTGTNGEVVSEGVGSIVLAVPNSLAPKLAFDSDNSRIWVLLRAPVWNKPAKSGSTTTTTGSK